MANSLLVVRFQARSEPARDQIVRAFEELVKDFKRSTLPTRRCFCCTPRDAPEDYSVYAIEERTTTDSNAKLDGNTVVEALQLHRTTDASNLAGPPQSYSLAIKHNFYRSEALSHTDPFILHATLKYDSEDSANNALEGFGGVCEYSKKHEPGVLGYNVLQDLQDPTIVRTLEVYVDPAYCWEVHAPSEAVQKNKERQGNTRLSTNFAFLHFVDGIL